MVAPEIGPVVLEGRHVRLEPLTAAHLPRLTTIGLEGDLFKWFPNPVGTPAEMQDFVSMALREVAAGQAVPLATILRSSGEAIGATRFGNIDRVNRRVEIGWTWVARPWQRTAANTEAKYLMMQHAFESWRCVRVEFKTDSLNAQSRTALMGIGATEEGTLRNHMVTASGRLRHSVYYSVTEEEWPAVKAHLERRLRTREDAPGPAGSDSGVGR